MATLYLPASEHLLEAIGLDVDGVLRDTGYHAYDATCKTIVEHGGKAPAYSDFVRDFTYDFLSYYQSCGARLTLEELMKTFGRHCMPPEGIAPYADVVEFLDFARRRGLKVFTVSAHPAAKVHEWFVSHGLDDHFLHLAGGSRNKVACIRDSCSRLGVATSRSCYIGDWGVDILAAREAPALSLGITRGYPSRDGLLACGADHVVDNLSELAGLIR